MDIAESIFEGKTASGQKLRAYGFLEEDGVYAYSTVLTNSGFVMTVSVTEQGKINAALIDPATEEPYTLHLADSASGRFVGGVKAEYEQILTEIADKCFESNVFQTDPAKKVILYIQSTYGDDLEFLWQKFDDNAVVRRKDNRKWYAVFLTVSRRKLGLDSDEKVEILDLRMRPEDIEKNVDGAEIFPGYHMNKKHWITVCLDGSVSAERIYALIDESYKLAYK